MQNNSLNKNAELSPKSDNVSIGINYNYYNLIYN